jgi:hypothetical protein
MLPPTVCSCLRTVSVWHARVVQRRSVAQRQRAAAHRAVRTMWSSWTAAAAATRLSEHTAAIIGAPRAHALGQSTPAGVSAWTAFGPNADRHCCARCARSQCAAALIVPCAVRSVALHRCARAAPSRSASRARVAAAQVCLRVTVGFTVPLSCYSSASRPRGAAADGRTHGIPFLL